MRQHPEVEAPVRAALGMAYLRQGRWADAEKQLRRGLELQRQLTGPDTPDVATYLNYIGQCVMYQKRYDQAVPLFRESLRVYAARGFKVIAPCAVKSNLAAAFAAQGKLADAEAVVRDALATAKGTPHAVRYDALEGIRALAGLLEEDGNVTSAAALREAMNTLREHLGGLLDRPVKPAADGTFVLTSATADLNGITIQVQPDGSIGRWTDRQDSVLWTLAPAAPGLYGVEIQYECDDRSAGAEFVLEVAGQSLAGVVKPSEGTQQYAMTTLGTVRVGQTATKLVVHSVDGGKSHGPLMTLHAVQLTPLFEASKTNP